MRRWKRLMLLAFVAGSILLILTACGTKADYRARDGLFDSKTPPAPADSAPATTPPPATASEPSAHEGAEEAASAALTSWARPQLSYAVWWSQLAPLLTVDAQESYSYTDPSNVPALTITGAAEEESAPWNPNATTFWFPTSGGRYGVDVVRPPGQDAWKAANIIFPGEESQRQG
jgi:hypothetical protein